MSIKEIASIHEFFQDLNVMQRQRQQVNCSMWVRGFLSTRASSHVLQGDSVLWCRVASACQADRLALTAWSERRRRGEKRTDFRTLQTTTTNSLPSRKQHSTQDHRRCFQACDAVSHWRWSNAAPVAQTRTSHSQQPTGSIRCEDGCHKFAVQNS